MEFEFVEIIQLALFLFVQNDQLTPLAKKEIVVKSKIILAFLQFYDTMYYVGNYAVKCPHFLVTIFLGGATNGIQNYQ